MPPRNELDEAQLVAVEIAILELGKDEVQRALRMQLAKLRAQGTHVLLIVTPKYASYMPDTNHNPRSRPLRTPRPVQRWNIVAADLCTLQLTCSCQYPSEHRGKHVQWYVGSTAGDMPGTCALLPQFYDRCNAAKAAMQHLSLIHI